MPSTIAKTQTGIGKGNTRIWNDNGHFSVQLHDTVIYDETRETVTLNNGDWITPTTVRRMNQTLIYRGLAPRVHVKKGEMYYGLIKFTDHEFHIDNVRPFAEEVA